MWLLLDGTCMARFDSTWCMNFVAAYAPSGDMATKFAYTQGANTSCLLVVYFARLPVVCVGLCIRDILLYRSVQTCTQSSCTL